MCMLEICLDYLWVLDLDLGLDIAKHSRPEIFFLFGI